MKKVNAAKLEMARIEELKAQGLDAGPPKPQVRKPSNKNISTVVLPKWEL